MPPPALISPTGGCGRWESAAKQILRRFCEGAVEPASFVQPVAPVGEEQDLDARVSAPAGKNVPQHLARTRLPETCARLLRTFERPAAQSLVRRLNVP